MANLCLHDDTLQRVANTDVEARQQLECAKILAAFRHEHLSETEAIYRLRALLAPPPATSGYQEREAKRLIFSKGYERATDSINVLEAAKLMVEFAALASPSVAMGEASATRDDG